MLEKVESLREYFIIVLSLCRVLQSSLIAMGFFHLNFYEGLDIFFIVNLNYKSVSMEKRNGEVDKKGF